MPRLLEGRIYQERKEEAAELQSSAGEVPAAGDLLPVRWLLCGGPSIRQVVCSEGLARICTRTADHNNVQQG